MGIARTPTGIVTARATMRTRSARATDFAMTGKVTPARGHFKRSQGIARRNLAIAEQPRTETDAVESVQAVVSHREMTSFFQMTGRAHPNRPQGGVNHKSSSLTGS